MTGRLLVGLRWWNDASAADGGTAWRFEALGEGQRAINPHERRWFWIVLVAAPILWALSAFAAFLGLDWGAARLRSPPLWLPAWLPHLAGSAAAA